VCEREEVGESGEGGGKIKNRGGCCGGGRWRNLRWF